MYINKSILLDSFSSMYYCAFIMNSLYLEFSVGKIFNSPLYMEDFTMWSLYGGKAANRK